MNLRASSFIDKLIDNMIHLDITDGDILVVNLPDGIDQNTSQVIASSITSALKACGKNNQVLLMPKGIGLEVLTDEDLKEIGLKRDDKSAPSNPNSYRLQKQEESGKSTEDIIEKHIFRSGETININPCSTTIPWFTTGTCSEYCPGYNIQWYY